MFLHVVFVILTILMVEYGWAQNLDADNAQFQALKAQEQAVDASLVKTDPPRDNSKNDPKSNDPVVNALSAEGSPSEDSNDQKSLEETSLEKMSSSGNSSESDSAKDQDDDPIEWKKIRRTFLLAFVIAVGAMFAMAVLCGILNVMATRRPNRGYVRT